MSHNEMIQLNQVQVTSEFWQRYRNLVVKEVLPLSMGSYERSGQYQYC